MALRSEQLGDTVICLGLSLPSRAGVARGVRAECILTAHDECVPLLERGLTGHGENNPS